jgi:hypothetical protein
MAILNLVCRKALAAVTLLFVGFLVPAKVAAQVDMGSISVAIHHPSGAAMPDAKVVLTNEDSRINVQTTTGPEGHYTFSPVKIGRYSISASEPGFKSTRQNNVTVDTQQKVELNIQRALGEATETVVVNEAPPLFQTLDAFVGQVIQEQAINDLPLNGRNITFSSR